MVFTIFNYFQLSTYLRKFAHFAVHGLNFYFKMVIAYNKLIYFGIIITSSCTITSISPLITIWITFWSFWSEEYFSGDVPQNAHKISY